MKQFKVESGNMTEIIEAESHEEAAAKLFTMFDDWIPDEDEPPSPGAYVSTVEVVGGELWHKTDDCIKRAGREGASHEANKLAARAKRDV